MRVDEFIRQLRQLVLEHPEAAREELCVNAKILGHRQHITSLHLNLHGTKVVIELEVPHA